MLLATFGNRRPTRDVDFAGREMGNDEATVLNLIKSVLAVQLSEDDGIEFAEFGDVLAEAITFAQPAIAGDLTDMSWDPNDRQWA